MWGIGFENLIKNKLADMYRGFNLKLETKFLMKINEVYYRKKGLEYSDNLKNFSYDFLEEAETLNGNKLMQEWFPSSEKFDIFLSHSHKDLNLALAIAGILKEELNLNVFIDSLVWGNCNNLLRQIDDQYCKNGKGLYNYNKRNYSTSHIHMMLMNSLNLMIDNCECLFFLNTPNSISLTNTIEQSTNSPWIFSEIITSKIIQKKTPKRLLSKTRFFSQEGYKNLNESMSLQLKIAYQTELSHLIEIQTDDFFDWISENYGESKRALDSLYEKFPLSNISFFNNGK